MIRFIKKAFFYSILLSSSLVWAIAGGTTIEAKEAPWYAQLSMEQGSCGGAIIGLRVILTAAHCMTDGGALKKVEGGGSGYIYGFTNFGAIKKIIVHPEWNAQSDKNLFDLALVILEKDIPLSESVKLVQLDHNFDMQNSTGQLVTIVGTGMKQNGSVPMNLQMLTMPLQPYFADKIFWSPLLGEISEQDYDKAFAHYGTSFLSTFSTEKALGACRGDSGGPLTTMTEKGPRLVGIASFVVGGCGGISNYTSVPYYLEWISQNLKDLEK